MTLYPNIYRTLAPGPVVELRGYAAASRLAGKLYACLDYGGPTGTARDGLAEGMLALAAQRKVLAPGQTLIEAGSGAFAAALALAGRTSGHPVCLAMPDNTPAGRQELLSGLGAQLLFSPAREGAAGARALAETWARKRGWYYTDWLACDDNPEYHRRVTGPAIAQAIAREGKSLVDAVFIGVGSGGTARPWQGACWAPTASRIWVSAWCPRTTTPMWWTKLPPCPAPRRPGLPKPSCSPTPSPPRSAGAPPWPLPPGSWPRAGASRPCA